MENQQIEKFDPSTLMQGVKDRIKATFVSLIPDTQWEQMVKTEVDGFFKTRESGYNYRSQVSDFTVLVNDCLKEECKKRMTEYLTSDDFITNYTNNGVPVVTEKVKQLIIENSGEILASMMGGVFSVMLMDFKTKMRNQY